MSRFLSAYAALLAIQKNIKEASHRTDGAIIDQYRTALKQVSEILGKEDFNAADFDVPQSEIVSEVGSFNTLTKETKYTGRVYTSTQLFKTKVDHVITYMTLIAPAPEKEQMGFHPRRDK